MLFSLYQKEMDMSDQKDDKVTSTFTEKASDTLDRVIKTVDEAAGEAAHRLEPLVDEASERLNKVANSVAARFEQARPEVEKTIGTLTAAGAELGDKVVARGKSLRDAAAKRLGDFLKPKP